MDAVRLEARVVGSGGMSGTDILESPTSLSAPLSPPGRRRPGGRAFKEQIVLTICDVPLRSDGLPRDHRDVPSTWAPLGACPRVA